MARTALWLALVTVPVALQIASGGTVYPPIDPASGGPTGTSLLGSSLGLIAILVGTPRLLGLTVVSNRRSWLAPAALAAHALLFLLLDHGDHGHREPVQQLALASVAIWAWLLPRELGRFLWPIGSRRWIGSLAAWGVLLLATGLAAFQPGVLERVKFGQGLVAHAHVAMAGFGSSFVVLLSHALLSGGRRACLWSGRTPFALWHAGLALQVVSLALLGAWESADPAALLRGGTVVETMLGLRWFGGAAMLGAAAIWGGGFLRGSR
jgi:cytochrome c oxidase cbb3-type subunit 1